MPRRKITNNYRYLKVGESLQSGDLFDYHSGYTSFVPASYFNQKRRSSWVNVRRPIYKLLSENQEPPQWE